MKVITNNPPAPIVQPPTTYTITGLTRAELEVIAAGVGVLRKADMVKSDLAVERLVDPDNHPVAFDMYAKLRNTLRDR